MKTLSSEVAGDGVRVNQVMPGATGTDRMQGIVEMKSRNNGTTVDAEIAKVVQDIPMAGGRRPARSRTPLRSWPLRAPHSSPARPCPWTAAQCAPRTDNRAG